MLATEIMNECFLLLLFYHNVLFTGIKIPGKSEETRKLFSQSMIFTVGAMVGCNLIVILIPAIQDTIRKRKLAGLKKKFDAAMKIKKEKEAEK